MKKFEIRLTGDSQFSHGVIAAGSLVATISMREPIEPTSLLSMIQFGQASMSAAFDQDEPIDQEPIDEVLDSIESETNLEGLTEELTQEPEPIASDLAEILDETLVEALRSNRIESKAQLLEFLASGKDLVDLDKIGATRAKRILAAVEGLK
jgi:hypothetical protein